MFRIFHATFISLFLMSCGTSLDEAPKQADEAMAELKRFYEEAKASAPDDPVQWAKDDFQRYGDWEYRVVSIDIASNDELEKQLNEFGEARWEVSWVQEGGSELRIMLKRPARSYLRSVQFSELGKVFSGDEAAE